MNNVTEKGKILLVDDDKFLLDMYSMKFSAAGYAVEACVSGKEALDVLRAGFKPDTILLDLTMPELDGFAFLDILSQEKLAPKALRIALTNQSENTEKAKAVESGADRYIVKASMIPSEVVNTVEEELKKKRP
ncbi:MAG: response regulator [Patescibacteria group bacterium]